MQKNMKRNIGMKMKTDKELKQDACYIALCNIVVLVVIATVVYFIGRIFGLIQ